MPVLVAIRALWEWVRAVTNKVMSRSASVALFLLVLVHFVTRLGGGALGLIGINVSGLIWCVSTACLIGVHLGKVLGSGGILSLDAMLQARTRASGFVFTDRIAPIWNKV